MLKDKKLPCNSVTYLFWSWLYFIFL